MNARVITLLILNAFLCCETALAQTAEEYLHAGERLYGQKRYPECIKALDRGIELDPKNAKLYFGRSLALSKCDDYKQANATLRKAISLDRKNRSYCYQLIQWGEFGNDQKQVIEGCTCLHAIDPNDPGPLIKIADAYRSLNDFDHELSADAAAIKALVKGKQDKKSKDALTDLYRNDGRVHAFRKEYQLAVADCTKALSCSPNDDITFKDRAKVYVATGQKQKALSDLTRCVELVPDSTDYLLRRAHFYYDLKDYLKALDDVNRAIPLESVSVDGLTLRVQIYDAIGKHDLAAKDRQSIDKRHLEFKPTKYFDADSPSQPRKGKQ